MNSWSREAAIAMEQRHIAEGEKRIQRQEALIRKLLPKGNQQLTLMASELLEEMRETLETSKARLRHLETERNP